MSKQDDNVNALTLGRGFFDELVKPSMERVCPEVLEAGAFGIFGNGSECFGMDDVYSRDHHWGPRVNILLPDELLQEMDPDIWKRVAADLPDTFKGFKLKKGLVGTAGLEPDGIGTFLTRTIGRTSLPENATDWLDMPEEDIAHVVNGEVWHDGSGEFTRIRSVLLDYYPDDVWKRRIAHWCRYASGMGLYAMQRAVMRKNLPFCFTAFGRTLELTMELAFLLNRSYFPYDKWLYPCFLRLDKLAPEMTPLIEESTQDDTSWERRIHLLEQLHTLLDDEMVRLGLVSPHPKFKPHESSGYRLLERGYRELLRAVPKELADHTPRCDQVFLEQFVTGYVAGLDEDPWLKLLNLEPE